MTSRDVKQHQYRRLVTRWSERHVYRETSSKMLSLHSLGLLTGNSVARARFPGQKLYQQRKDGVKESRKQTARDGESEAAREAVVNRDDDEEQPSTRPTQGGRGLRNTVTERIEARVTIHLGLEIDPRSTASPKNLAQVFRCLTLVSAALPFFAMPPKSIFRQPGAQHFQVVHRSQRDPLIHDPEASKHVLKPVVRGNLVKVCSADNRIWDPADAVCAQGKSRAELEQLLAPSDLAHDKQRANIGEAAAYGIYFDDTEYDYMQHLKPVGVQEDGVDSIWLEAPSKSKGKGKAQDLIELLDLPEGTLASKVELPRNYESQQEVPSSIAGFQPDMDPHLRQVLEALEDDAFVDEGLEDDFFGALVADGERAADEEYKYEFREDGVLEVEDVEAGQVAAGEEDESWEVRFARFKREQQSAPQNEDTSEYDAYSEGGDTVGTLPQLSVIGGKKRRRKGASDASGYSMSSSSMWRNEHLTVLDERFDQVCP